MSKPIVTFIIPVKSKTISSSWDRFSLLFERTIKSITNQTNENFQVIVVCHEKPNIIFEHPSIKYIRVDFPPPDLTSSSTEYHWALKERDKARKIQVGLKFIKKEPSPYFMVVDADDCISNNCVSIVDKIGGPTEIGWYFDQGYLYKEGSSFIVYKKRKFSQICGTGIIVSTNLANEMFNEHPVLHYLHKITFLTDSGELKPFPIPGSIYSMINGENHFMSSSQLKEEIHRKNGSKFTALVVYIKRLFNNPVLLVNNRIRQEFGLYKI